MSKSSVDGDGNGDPNIILTVICECRGLFQNNKGNCHEIVFPPAVTCGTVALRFLIYNYNKSIFCRIWSAEV